MQVFTGAAPFNDLQPTIVILSILQGKRPQQRANPSVTGRLWKSIQQCWNEDPQLRPEASEVLQTLLNLLVPRSFQHSLAGLTAFSNLGTLLHGNG